jgi:hypothetical protein
MVFPDDTLNAILRAAWWGGLLEFPVDPALLGGVDLSGYGITNLNMVVSGWLPPLASDCGAAGDLRLYVGDLEITATMDLFGQPLSLLVYVSFEAPISLAAAAGQVQITVSAVENVALEVTVLEEDLIGSEGVIRDLLETQLVPALGALLGDGEPLGSFPLPEIDLSESVGLPPGTVQFAIDPLTSPDWPPRLDGNTIIYGQMR